MPERDKNEASRDALRGRILALIEAVSEGDEKHATRDRLLTDIAAYQRARLPAFARLWASDVGFFGDDGLGFPALPTEVFRYARIATFEPSLTARTFLTSGTSSGRRGQHPFRDLSLYDAAAQAAARHGLFRSAPNMRLVILAPRPEQAPTSSLSYMLGRFEAWFSSGAEWVFDAERLDVGSLRRALDACCERGEAVAVLGTSFAFVHAEDALGQVTFRLPPGSRLMQTGGFKGRSREVSEAALLRALTGRYGVAAADIVSEYGMTELSSQCYRAGTERGYRPPGWVRATVVDPENLRPTAPGQPGLLRIDDAANLDSCVGILTADLAVLRDGRFELLGRAPGAVARGCSLSVEEALAGERADT